MKSKPVSRYFVFMTAIEITSLIIIVIIVLSLAIPEIQETMSKSHQGQCRKNLQKVGLLLEKAVGDQPSTTPVSFVESVHPILDNPGQAFCPESGDLYDNYFLPEGGGGEIRYLVGCPHDSSLQYVYTSATHEVKACKPMEFYADGVAVERHGVEVSASRIQFGDGSILNIRSGSLYIVASFQLDNSSGKSMTILRMLEKNMPQTLVMEIKGGRSRGRSTFAIVTPATVITSNDGNFMIECHASQKNDSIITSTRVKSGKISYHLPGEREEVLQSMESAELVRHRQLALRDPYCVSLQHINGIEIRQKFDFMRQQALLILQHTAGQGNAAGAMDGSGRETLQNQVAAKINASASTSATEQRLSEFKYRFRRL